MSTVEEEEDEKDNPKAGSPTHLRGVRWMIALLKFFISQWKILGIAVAVIFAWLFPNVGRRGGVIESEYDCPHASVL